MNSTVTPSLEVPMHSRIFSDLKQAVVRGDFLEGERLPTEAELSRQYGTSRTTVVRALRDLASTGLVLRRQGSGTYVSGREVNRGRAPKSIAYCPLYVNRLAELGHVEGLIHHHLADLANKCSANLSAQCLPAAASLRKAMMAAADGLIARKVDGVLYYPAQLPPDQMHYNREVVDRLKAAGIAIVLVDRELDIYPYRSEFTRVGYDNRRGAFMLADHMIRVGCRRIAFVGVPFVSTAVQERLTGFRDGLAAHGIVPDSKLIVMDNDLGWEVNSDVRQAVSPDLGRQLCERLIDAGVDGIICKADVFAAIIGRHLTARGLQIGRDIRIAGFDDDPIASLLPVPLTTVRLPAQPFAEAAFDALLRQITNPRTLPQQIVIDCELVIRDSTSGGENHRPTTARFSCSPGQTRVVHGGVV